MMGMSTDYRLQSTAMKFRFENLHVWQDARNFINQIYTLTKKFPTSEKLALIDQLRRAAVSIALNITEGSDRKSDIEFIRYLRMALTSTEEVVTALYIALDQKYIQQKDFDKLYQEAHMIVAKLNALIKSLRSTDYRLPQRNGSPKTVDGRLRKNVGSHQKGFTLIELMVAIAIIATVSTIGLTTFSGSQEKARDTIRKNHLNSLSTALEFYLQKNDQYIISPNCETNPASSTFYNAIKDYLSGGKPPIDPTTDQAYCYISEKGDSFRIFAKLERCDDKDIFVDDNTCKAGKYNYTIVSEGLSVALAPGNTGSLAAAPSTPIPSPTSTPTSAPSQAPTSTPTPTPTPFKYVFLTSQGYGGNLQSRGGGTDGIDGADRICKTLADATNSLAVVKNKTWKAWISTDTQSPATRNFWQGQYRLVNGTTVVADNWLDLTDGALDAAITMTETGGSSSDNYTWTNTGINGQKTSDTQDCSNWQSNQSSIVSSGTGARGSSNSSWTTSGATLSCVSGLTLYCFEQ